MVSLNYIDLSNEQRRQLIDAQQVFSAWRPASHELAQLGAIIAGKLLANKLILLRQNLEFLLRAIAALILRLIV